MSPKVLKACEHLQDLFFRALPREVRGSMGEVFHCYVDASFEPGGGFCGIGGCLFSSTGEAVSWFGSQVDPKCIDLILEAQGEMRSTAIYELECVAVAVALEMFKSFLMHRCVLLFTDNQGVLGTMVRCWSDNRCGNGLARIVCLSEESMFAHIWFERVPSMSNPAMGTTSRPTQ